MGEKRQSKTKKAEGKIKNLTLKRFSDIDQPTSRKDI